MPKSSWIMLLLILSASGCATHRPGWQWANITHSKTVPEADEESDCEEEPDCEEEETANHRSLWRKLLPWDHQEDTRPYDERLDEFNEKFRNNG